MTTTISLRRLSVDVVDLLKERAHANKRSLEAEMRAIATTAALEQVGPTWRCFHCGEVFTNLKHATAHFGIDQLSDPGCVAVLRGGEEHLLRRIRDLQEDALRHADEDSDVMRWARVKESAHAQAITNAEQKGYDRGLKDGREEKTHEAVT